jgi:5-aminolevulinate synthase
VDYDRIFRAAIDRLHVEGRYRVFIDILRTKGQYPNAQCFAGHNGPKPITVWCSNDYLGMGQHPAVVAAMEEALHQVGAGSGGTRNIGGNTHYHVELERELAGLHGKQSALLFTSGYVSN